MTSDGATKDVTSEASRDASWDTPVHKGGFHDQADSVEK
jgi:hypothetical protein